jgi:hypothetical protein
MVFGQTEVLKKNLKLYLPAVTFSLDNSLHTGEIINWGNGDVLLTHTSNKLAFTGGVVDFSVLPTVAGSSLSALYTSGNISIGANSLLLTGSIAATANRVLKGWFTDLEITNLPSISGVAITTTAAKLNYLTSATGTTGTSSTNIVFSTSPGLTTPTVVTSIVGDATFAAFNTVTTTLTFGGAATTLTVGGTPSTAVTHNYSTNPTATGTTKTVNVGTGAVSGSTTNVNIGSAYGGTTTVTSPTLTVAALTVGVDTCKNIETSKSVAGLGLLRCTGTCTLKGLAGGVAGQILKIVNTTATTLTLKHNGAGTQKFYITGAADLALTAQGNAVTAVYDGSYWYITGKGQ